MPHHCPQVLNFVIVKKNTKMSTLAYFLLMSTIWIAVQSTPLDDGKYDPKKYKIYDDGKYYRSLDEGKYIPSDEGKYTYIYKQGLYPEDEGDYRYKHQEGPNGFGRNGGYGPNGGYVGNGHGDDNGPNGSGGPDGLEKHHNKYVGPKIYANRYPYIHQVINALVDKYVSLDALTTESSVNHFSKVSADKVVAAKCTYLSPGKDEMEFVTQYPPILKLHKWDKLGPYYSFKGTKVLNTVSNTLTTKVKLQYEVFVRIVDEVSEPIKPSE